eukprot:TRINITY_DN643_c2_g1_i1.p1 TRINITY_DN643_c2_g1~~TRINITY_DN643_c2_g1_i1.p1  ORF type:complete len:492 (-),score=75.25 TRINITY_DN643_c2_g1_i1:39-1490(-)
MGGGTRPAAITAENTRAAAATSSAAPTATSDKRQATSGRAVTSAASESVSSQRRQVVTSSQSQSQQHEPEPEPEPEPEHEHEHEHEPEHEHEHEQEEEGEKKKKRDEAEPATNRVATTTGTPPPPPHRHQERTAGKKDTPCTAEAKRLPRLPGLLRSPELPWPALLAFSDCGGIAHACKTLLRYAQRIFGGTHFPPPCRLELAPAQAQVGWNATLKLDPVIWYESLCGDLGNVKKEQLQAYVRHCAAAEHEHTAELHNTAVLAAAWEKVPPERAYCEREQNGRRCTFFVDERLLIHQTACLRFYARNYDNSTARLPTRELFISPRSHYTSYDLSSSAAFWEDVHSLLCNVGLGRHVQQLAFNFGSWESEQSNKDFAVSDCHGHLHVTLTSAGVEFLASLGVFYFMNGRVHSPAHYDHKNCEELLQHVYSLPRISLQLADLQQTQRTQKQSLEHVLLAVAVVVVLLLAVVVALVVLFWRTSCGN